MSYLCFQGVSIGTPLAIEELTGTFDADCFSSPSAFPLQSRGGPYIFWQLASISFVDECIG